ncbi:MAG: hypothetical protein IT372_18810 [Polyangiaceae bacterium]|nr:hypothetical protein [Polyangiaceae bacterium]
MRKTSLLLALLIASLLLLLSACPGTEGPGPGTVIVGLSTELQPGVDIDRLHVVMRAGGEVIRDEIDTTADGTLELPEELPFENLADGTAVEVELEAFRPGDATRPLLTRTASTEIVGGRTLLLRVRLEKECVIPPGQSGCEAPQTCVAGACSSPRVDPSRLEEYTPGWSLGEPDVCKPAGAGAPVVVVGEGQADYLPLTDGEEVQVEAGPQGGHHIWIAIRMKNLRQSGSITSISGTVPELGLEIPPFNVIFTFDQDEGGYCKLYGLRFQLDTATDIQGLLGKVVNVKVTVTDSEGDVGVGERQVTLSPTTI